MTREPDTPIVITDGTWMHIRQIQAYHRHYPELRGGGQTRAEALDHLANQLIRALDFTPGCQGREEVEQALTDVRAIGRRVTRGQIAAIPRRCGRSRMVLNP